MKKEWNTIISSILLVLCIFILKSNIYAQEDFLIIEEIPMRTEQKQLQQNTAEAVFISATNDMVISTSNPSVDNVSLPYKNSNNEYEYKLTLDLSKGHNGRYFTVEKKGTGFRAKTKQKIIFNTGECRYFKIVEPEIKFVLNQIEEGTHLVQGEACIEFYSPIPDLNLEINKSLKYSTEVSKNSAGTYITSLKINTIDFDNVRERYKNQEEELEEIMTLAIGFTNSNLVTIKLPALTARTKIKYNIIPRNISSQIQEYGYIRIESMPSGATWILDDSLSGTTPDIIRCLVGLHRIEISKTHYKTMTITKEVRKDSSENVFETLEGIDVQVLIKTKEPNCNLFANNNQLTIQHSTWSGKLPKGEYIFRATKNGFHDSELEAIITIGESNRFIIPTPQRQTSENVQINNKQNTHSLQTFSRNYCSTKAGFFFTANAAYTLKPQWSCGLTLGGMNDKWGLYADVMSNFNFKGFNNAMKEGEVYELSGKTNTSRHSAMLGAVISFGKDEGAYCRFGVGVGYRARNYEVDNTMMADPNTLTLGVNAEYGVMMRVNKLLIAIDVVTLNLKYWEAKVGIGCFIPGR